MNVNEKYKGFSIIGDYIEEQTFRVGYDNPVEIYGAQNEAVFSMVGKNGRLAL